MIRVGTCNIMDNPDMAREKVRATAKIAAENCDLVGFQEIGEVEDHEDVDLELPTSDWWTEFDGNPDPIGIRKSRFTLVGGETKEVQAPLVPTLNHVPVRGRLLLHTGKHGISPSRWMVWRMVAGRVTNRPIIFANTHMVSGKDNPKYSGENRLWRQEMWDIGYAKWAEKINGFNDAGFTVIFVGDFNSHTVPRPDKDVKWLYNSGIDKIGALEADFKVRLHDVATFDTPSDHHLRVASVELVGK